MDSTLSLPMHVLELAAFAQYSNAEEKLVRVSRRAGLPKETRATRPVSRSGMTLIHLNWFQSP